MNANERGPKGPVFVSGESLKGFKKRAKLLPAPTRHAILRNRSAMLLWGPRDGVSKPLTLALVTATKP